MLNATIKLRLKNILPKFVLEALVSLRRLSTPRSNIDISHLAGKKGIEIGGPSNLYSSHLPIYQKIYSLDGVNFSNTTLWEGEIKSGQNYNYFRNRKGYQFICEATDLSQINDNAYDFLLSSNCLEHIANPMMAIMEWKRVLKSRGTLILVLPSKASNFDHKRPTTSFEHLLEDFDNNTTEHDLTHLPEILNLHDLSMDPQAGSFQNFEKRSLDNYSNRALHHHVFDLNVTASMLEHCGFEIIQQTEEKNNFFTSAKRDS